MKQILLLQPFNRKNAFQFFHLWFSDAWRNDGNKIIKNLNLPWITRLAVAKLRLSFSIQPLKSPKKVLLVLCAGYPDSFIWPFSYRYEVVPIIWDSWPRYWPRLLNSFNRNNVKLAFFTSSQVANLVQEKIPAMQCIWIPEGINVNAYKKGDVLSNRKVDLLELGRLMPSFHENIIENNSLIGIFTHLFQEKDSAQLLFKNIRELADGISDSKISICFPRCDTHPGMAGNIETLTQRYWECMLSRTIILGRAPSELVNLVGYNPVVPVNWENPSLQVAHILKNINNYQSLVDKNLKTALKYASWDNRIILLKKELEKNGYITS